MASALPKVKPRNETPLQVTWKMDLTEEEKNKAIKLASSGVAQYKLAEQMGFPHTYAFQYFLAAHPLFATELKAAYIAGYHQMAESVVDIIDEYADPQAARIKIDSIKWLVSKRLPEVYGDRIDVNVNQNVSIKSNIDAAESRVAKTIVELSPKRSDSGDIFE